MHDIAMKAFPVLVGTFFLSLAWVRVRPVLRPGTELLARLPALRDATVLALFTLLFLMTVFTPQVWAYFVLPVLALAGLLGLATKAVMWQANHDTRQMRARMGLPILRSRVRWWVVFVTTLLAGVLAEMIVLLVIAAGFPQLAGRDDVMSVVVIGLQFAGLLVASIAGALQWLRWREREALIRKMDQDLIAPPPQDAEQPSGPPR